MSKYRWGARSMARLSSCDPLLIELLNRVISRDDLPCDITVLCGHRTQAEQDAAVAAGASKLRWPKSKHNSMPSRAVDVAPYVDGAVSWDWVHYKQIAPLIKDEWGKMVAEGLVPVGAGTTLTWGGDWKKFPDGPHWELG